VIDGRLQRQHARAQEFRPERHDYPVALDPFRAQNTHA
jgi:hypothetical protein